MSIHTNLRFFMNKLIKSGTITEIPYVFQGFLKTNKYSCASRRKLYFTLLVFQKPVALQLCCSFMIISFVLKPDCSKTRIVSNARGCTMPFFRISPIKIAQNFPFLRTLYASSDTFFISTRNSFFLQWDKSPGILSLYCIMSAYGGCVQIRSTLSFSY